MRILAGLLFLCIAASSSLAQSLYVHVSLQNQSATVYQHNNLEGVWKVSTGARGHETPPGRFRPDFLSKDHVSSIYDVPMPYAVFFNGNIALHATEAERLLGKVASHGCVRLSMANAMRLFALVKKHGLAQTLIVVE